MNFKKLQIFLAQRLIIKIYQNLLLKKQIEVYDQSEKNYSPNKGIRIKTSMLRSDLCNFSDTYIVVEGTITLEGDNNANKQNKNLAFKKMHHLLTTFQKLMT